MIAQTVISSVTVIMVALIGVFGTRPGRQSNRTQDEMVKVQGDIATSVNGQHDALTERVEQLIAALTTAGVFVPAPEKKKET